MSTQPRTRVIMGVDPGISNGVAFAIQHVDGRCVYQSFTTNTEEMWDFIDKPVTVVIVEQFSASLISTYGLHTVETVGGVMALCKRLDITVVRDTPQQRRPYIEAARKIVKDGTRHDRRHEVDAMSHVLFWMYHNVPGSVQI